MKIAIVGAGISGLTAAYLLNREHDITVYEAASEIGGHTATKQITLNDEHHAIDTGFIVFNDWTYPNFKALLKQLNVPYQPTEMGFSVSCEETGLEYSGNNLNTLFAQRRNLFNINHWRMIKDILRFNKESLRDVESGGAYLTMTLNQYLEVKAYSSAFIEHYLIPMGAAIWSAPSDVMRQFPLQFFVRFFRNHGLLSVNDRPQWHVIKGGSQSYLQPLTAHFRDRIKVNAAVTRITRDSKGVLVQAAGEEEHYDQIVLACHSDQALAMLGDPSNAETNILGAIPYQDNEVVLHTDHAVLPTKRSTWSSWNYRITQNSSASESLPVLTYNMNILQSLESDTTFCVTLNNTKSINKNTILGVYHYAHPVFSLAGIDAQSQWPKINGVNHTWYCGAYWANGFHEDGVVSALRVAQQFGITL